MTDDAEIYIDYQPDEKALYVEQLEYWCERQLADLNAQRKVLDERERIIASLQRFMAIQNGEIQGLRGELAQSRQAQADSIKTAENALSLVDELEAAVDALLSELQQKDEAMFELRRMLRALRKQIEAMTTRRAG